MQINLLREARYKRRLVPHKFILVMKITTLILFACFMQLSAEVHSQISISERNVPITSVLAKIQQQSGYNLFYENTKINDVKVNVKLSNVTLKDALDQVLKDHNLTYAIVDKTIVVKLKTPSFLDRMVDALTPPIDVRGMVRDAEGNPLAGATVRVKGANRSVLTDGEGKFYLASVDEKAVLVVTYVGYKEMEIGVKSELSIQLEMKTNDLDETIVVAYGTTTQRTNTGAVTVLKGEQIESIPVRSVDKALQGLVPGLVVTNGTGQPGGGVSNFVLRGISAGASPLLGSTARNPLFVIDGVPVSQDHFQSNNNIAITDVPVTNPMAQLNPGDIASISVLKDAAAIALYGSQASNGVILITTKQGKTGTTHFDFRHQTDIQQKVEEKIQVLDQEEYLNLLYSTYKTSSRLVSSVATPYSDADILADLKAKFPTRADGSFYPTYNFGNELYNNKALTFSNQLSISGGSDKILYYMSLENTKQDGIVKNSGFDRKSLRLNLNSKPNSFLKFGTNSTFSFNNQDVAYDNGMSYFLSPLNSVYDDNGNFIWKYNWGTFETSTGTGTQTPNLIAVNKFNTNNSKAYRGLIQFNGEATFLKYFKLTSLIGTDFMLAENKYKTDPRLGVGSTLNGSISEENHIRYNLINTNSLHFNRIWKDHSINMLVSQEARVNEARYLQGSGIGNAGVLPYYDQFYSPGYTIQPSVGTKSKQTLLSQFAQVQYGFLNRYFLTSSIRRDGASVFGDQQQWGNFWSLGGGWILSNEPLLMSKNKETNYFKLRASIGAAGNSSGITPSRRYEDLTLLSTVFGPALVLTNGPDSRAVNYGLQWEETFSWNVGADTRLFNDRISLTADVYLRRTSNLINSVNIPYTSGRANTQMNIGDMKNVGIETTVLVHVVKNSTISWDVSSNWSVNKNKLVKAFNPIVNLTGTFLANGQGHEYNSYYLRRWAGINPADGSPQWLDINNNVTGNFNSANQVFMGNSQPEGFGNLLNNIKYRSFQLSLSFYYEYGKKLYDGVLSSLSNDGAYPYINQSTTALNYWKSPGDVTLNGARRLNNSSGISNGNSDRYLFRADHIRFQSVKLDYAFTVSWLRKLSVTSLNVFVQGHNLGLWSLFPGKDVDNSNVVGAVRFAYPLARSFSGGMQIGF